jgi:hypothetical protein
VGLNRQWEKKLHFLCVPYGKVYRYNPIDLCPKLNGYGDNGQRSLKLFDSCYKLVDYQIHTKTGRNMWFL